MVYLNYENPKPLTVNFLVERHCKMLLNFVYKPKCNLDILLKLKGLDGQLKKR